MQWIATPLVPAQTCHHHGTNITPSALVDGFVHVDVFRFLSAVLRSIGRKANAFRCRPDVPAFIGVGDVDLCPELGVLVLVVGMQVVDVKSTDVTEDLFGALVAPVVGGVTNDVVMGAGEPPIVTKVIELCFREFLNTVNVTELSWYGINQIGHWKDREVRGQSLDISLICDGCDE